MEYVTFTKQNGYFYAKRQEQNIRILYETIDNMLKDRFYNNPDVSAGIEQFKKDILENKISGYKAAEILVNDYLVRN